ncbi:uncharacterized protein LOC143123095 [Alosa pseudoharengus]|uniref:uncharacterized protein LOC143123095 n=1 Tax=Alosa pseudoharengus TaxID=34774 RepID=UPI003F8C6AFA
MASSSPRFTWCACRKHKIPSKDTHEQCLHCLGIQHAKEAVLEYGKCPHCAKMDWSSCINRLTKVQEVMHRESQQRKHEAAQAGAQPKPETTTASVTDAKPVQDVVCSTQPVPRPVVATPGPTSSTMPVMFTILSPPPVPAESDAGVVKGAFMSHVAIQQSADSTPSLSYQTSHPLSTSSHKRKRLSKCHTRCSKHFSRSHGHRRRCSSSSSSSPFWSSSDSSCTSALREKRRRREGRRSQKPKELHDRLLQVVEQKLEAQQQAMQIQWAMMERRLEALEKKDSEAAAAAAAVAVSSAPACRAVHVPQPSTSSQGEEQRDWSGSTSDAVVTGSIPLTIIKQEEEAASKPEATTEAERQGGPSRAEGAVSKQDILTAKELQSLIARAAKYLGVTFPKTSPNLPDPTMASEFEELVQSTWPNPASSKPFREVCSEMYRLNESQALAYDRMPQVNRFMSAIFQAVKPTDSIEQGVPADRWRLTEMLTEGTYQTAGMLAKTANYLHYLSDYQQRLLVEITEDHPAQRFVTVLNELKLIGQFAHQLSSHQAELSGRAMAASVAIRRQVWMAKTNYTDALKATVADLPFVLSQSVGVGSGGSSSSDNLCKQEH